MAYVSRVAKGSPLTYEEMDGNFAEMDSQFLAATDAAASSVSAKDAAQLAQGAAEDARDDAVIAQGAAESARDDALLAKIGAEDARDEVIDLLDASAPTIADIQGRIRVLQYADGPYPSLDLQFVGATRTAPALVFERASSATYYDALGRIVTAGANEPRLTFDPVTGKSLGLLVEGQATNLLLGSDSPATQTVVVTATAMTLSFIGTGTITLSGAYTGALVGTGDERVTMTFTPSAGSLTLTVSGNVEFAQLETGPVATSYIPTEGSQVTRAADNVTMPTSEFPFNPNEGTFVVEFRRRENYTDPVADCVLDLRSGVDYWAVEVQSNVRTRSSLTPYQPSPFTPDNVFFDGTINKVALSIADSTMYKVAVNGKVNISEGDQTGVFSLYQNVEQVRFKRIYPQPFQGSDAFSRLVYYPRALSDSELIALTTP